MIARGADISVKWCSNATKSFWQVQVAVHAAELVASNKLMVSSSRRQSDTRIASADTPCTCWALSTEVRQRPSVTGWVVTQFVTQTGDDHVQ
jgi:hypothetical protein